LRRPDVPGLFGRDKGGLPTRAGGGLARCSAARESKGGDSGE
jgi:hypothetical protein